MIIHLDPTSDIFQKLKQLTKYNGKKMQIEVTDYKRPLHSYWDGGSRDTYIRYDMNGNSLPLRVKTAPMPFDNSETPIYEPNPNEFLVEHSYYAGKDMGLTIYLHPLSILVPLLPMGKPDISNNEIFILNIISGLKSFARDQEYKEAGFSKSEVDEYKRILFEKGFINKAGAITVSGRNVVNAIFDSDICKKQSFRYGYKKEEILKSQEA